MSFLKEAIDLISQTNPAISSFLYNRWNASYLLCSTIYTKSLTITCLFRTKLWSGSPCFRYFSPKLRKSKYLRTQLSIQLLGEANPPSPGALPLGMARARPCPVPVPALAPARARDANAPPARKAAALLPLQSARDVPRTLCKGGEGTAEAQKCSCFANETRTCPVWNACKRCWGPVAPLPVGRRGFVPSTSASCWQATINLWLINGIKKKKKGRKLQLRGYTHEKSMI